ncbi:hypothetical protein ACH5RR_026355 [Cinchona calisaya]|uniref:F-box protein Hrt3/FBXO9 C-terminal domain-containing protein n=1 Tax=Cinchona calisaya TaxID=153742 RepID=A0ABD2Z3F3_9GENT
MGIGGRRGKKGSNKEEEMRGSKGNGRNGDGTNRSLSETEQNFHSVILFDSDYANVSAASRLRVAQFFRDTKAMARIPITVVMLSTAEFTQKVKDMVKFMNFCAPKGDCVFGGHYTLSEDKVEAAFLYPDDNEVTGSDVDIRGVVEEWQEDETHNPNVPAITHNRGLSHLTPFVFVPFEEVETSVLNLPVERMDYYYVVL